MPIKKENKSTLIKAQKSQIDVATGAIRVANDVDFVAKMSLNFAKIHGLDKSFLWGALAFNLIIFIFIPVRILIAKLNGEEIHISHNKWISWVSAGITLGLLLTIILFANAGITIALPYLFLAFMTVIAATSIYVLVNTLYKKTALQNKQSLLEQNINTIKININQNLNKINQKSNNLNLNENNITLEQEEILKEIDQDLFNLHHAEKELNQIQHKLKTTAIKTIFRSLGLSIVAIGFIGVCVTLIFPLSIVGGALLYASIGLGLIFGGVGLNLAIKKSRNMKNLIINNINNIINSPHLNSDLKIYTELYGDHAEPVINLLLAQDKCHNEWDKEIHQIILSNNHDNQLIQILEFFVKLNTLIKPERTQQDINNLFNNKLLNGKDAIKLFDKAILEIRTNNSYIISPELWIDLTKIEQTALGKYLYAQNININQLRLSRNYPVINNIKNNNQDNHQDIINNK